MTIHTFKIELCAMAECPVHRTHKRGKNWGAILRHDPTMPSGIGHEFLSKAHPPYYYEVDRLKIGDPVEFGAASYGDFERSYFYSWFGVVLAIDAVGVAIEEHWSAEAAIKASEAMATGHALAQAVSDGIRALNLSRYTDAELLAELKKRGCKAGV